MRIMVLAHNLRAAGGLSVGLNVLSSLSQVGDQHEYFLILPADVGYESISLPTKNRTYYYHRTRGSIGQFWFERTMLPKLARQYQPDLVWGLGNFGLPHPPGLQAFLLHMPQFLYGSQHARLQLGERVLSGLMRRRMVKSLPSTQLVFCQTQTMARRFSDQYHFSGEVAIMPNAVSRFAAPSSDVCPPVFETYRGKTVLFCLSKYYPHKNLESLLELFQRHGDRLRNVVVLTTIDPATEPRAAAFMAQLPKFQDQIVNVGRLAQHELSAYYRHSSALLLPTLLESYTATYLEAMRFDCPVLTSDMDFAREVCGDAALYFDPWNVDSMADAIIRLRDDASLQERLRFQARERLKQDFPSWTTITADALHRLEMLTANVKLASVSARPFQISAA